MIKKEFYPQTDLPIDRKVPKQLISVSFSNSWNELIIDRRYGKAKDENGKTFMVNVTKTYNFGSFNHCIKAHEAINSLVADYGVSRLFLAPEGFEIEF